MTRFLLVGSILALAVSPAPVAHACSANPECSPPSGTLPADGAIDVPLNVELEGFVYWPSVAGAPALALRVADTGEEITLVAARTPGRMRAQEPLEPATRYELLVPRELAVRESATCDDELAVRATFTTGAHADDVAPTSVTASGGGCGIDVCVESSCCGPYVAVVSSATWSATDDVALPIAYAFGSPDGARTFTTSGGSARLVAGMFIGSGAIASRGDSIVDASPVFAIDAAGNVSATSATFGLDFSCAPSAAEAAMYLRCDGGVCEAPDAGTRPSRDAGAAMDAGASNDADAGSETSTRSSSSCAVGRGRRGSAALAAIAGIAAFALATRRRSPARR